MKVDNRRILSVSQINTYVRDLLESIPLMNALYVRGEISNMTHHKSGNKFFTLKDEGGVLKAVMFRSDCADLKFLPQDGMKVICFGRISAFPRDGIYQLYVKEMEPDGIGSLAAAYEQLKEKLAGEGLFDEARKKPLPKYPKKVGVITSPTGAAVRDIINITGRRFPLAEILLFPSLVQGEGAPEQLIAALDYFNATDAADVIILGRGGGSIEDLWAFNNEALARAIAASRIPVISAVGHETDFTIADFVADCRAPTPSAAAELAVPDAVEVKRKLGNVVSHCELLMAKRIDSERAKVSALASRRVLRDPTSPIDEKRMLLLSMEKRLGSEEKILLSEKRASFVSLSAKLDALNPLSVLTRGYAAVFREDGKVVKSVDDLNIDDCFTLRTSDGEVKGKVLEKHGCQEK